MYEYVQVGIHTFWGDCHNDNDDYALFC